MQCNEKVLHKFYDRGIGRRCIASFNSLGADKGFEWTKALAEYDCNSLHIASCEPRSWYHFCLPETLELIKEYNPDLLIGASMGGYAALLFGSLLNIRAIVFGPQTTLLDVPWDRRWQHEWQSIREKTEHPQYLDLSGLDHSPTSQIYYCSAVLEDKRHAKNAKVEVIERGCARHEEASRNLPRGIFN